MNIEEYRQKQKFRIYKGKKNELPIVAVMDELYPSFGFPEDAKLFTLHIKYSDKDLKGLPTIDIQKKLDNFEDQVEKIPNLIFIGRFTWNGDRFLFFVLLSDQTSGIEKMIEIASSSELKIEDRQLSNDVDYEYLSEFFPKDLEFISEA